MTRYTCIGLLARAHGLAVARALLESQSFQLAALFTHRYNPRSQDTERRERDDYRHFVSLAAEYNIPFYPIDVKANQQILLNLLREKATDFLVSVSWRYILPQEILSQARIGTINVHRGDLPQYAGAEPVKQALLNKEQVIAICAHQMIAALDEGPVLVKATHPVNYCSSQTLDQNVDRLKREITSYYPQLVTSSLKRMLHDRKP